MNQLINNLIFPAPKPAGYTHAEFQDRLIYIPKFKDLNQFSTNKEN